MFNLAGKVAIITGGNGGIGLGIATGIASAGATVVLAARNVEKMKDAVKGLQDSGFQASSEIVDVNDEDSVANLINGTVNKYGRLDILVNNAGTTIRKDPQDYEESEWDQVMDINLKGTFLCSKHAYQHMVNVGGGKIINIGSMTSIFGLDIGAVYSASKGGVVQLNKSLSNAWAKDNIQVNCILPGWIHTELTAPIKLTNQPRYESILSRIPQDRWGEPEDLSGTGVFLASSASDYVTGVSIPVDGGYTAF